MEFSWAEQFLISALYAVLEAKSVQKGTVWQERMSPVKNTRQYYRYDRASVILWTVTYFTLSGTLRLSQEKAAR